MFAAVGNRFIRLTAWVGVIALLLAALAIGAPSAARADEGAGGEDVVATAPPSDDSVPAPGDSAEPPVDSTPSAPPVSVDPLPPTGGPDEQVAPTPSTPVVPSDERPDAGSSDVPTPSRPSSRSATVAGTASISGRITTASGAALPDAVAFAVMRVDEEWGTSWNWVSSATADASGNYSISGLEPGVYTVQFSGSGGYVTEFWNNAVHQADATTFTLTTGPKTGVNASLAVGGTISGTLSSSAGPLSSGYVDVYGADSSWIAGTWVGSDGGYSISALPAGTYKVRFSGSSDSSYIAEWWDDASTMDAATPISVALGSVVSGRNAVLAVGATVGGRITGPDGAPVQSANVVLALVGGGWSDRQSVYTDSDGVYRVSGLLPGSYTLHVDDTSASGLLSEYWNNHYGGSPDAADAITVASGATLTRDVRLERAASISGVIADLHGAAQSGLYVSAERTDDDDVSWYANTQTTSDGGYSLSGLIPGTYHITFWIGSISNEADVTVAEGGRITKNFAVSTGSALTGTVKGPDGAPLGGVYVSVTGIGGANGASATTAEDGTYRAIGLVGGRYTVAFTAGAKQYLGGGRLSAGATTISIPNDGEAHADFQFGGVTLSGRVSFGGAGDASASVSLYSRDTLTTISGSTGPDGRYSFIGVPAGQYVMAVYPSYPTGQLGYVQTWSGGGDDPVKATYLTIGTSSVIRDVALLKGATISGTLKTSSGAAASRASVAAYRWSADGSREWTRGVQAGTDGTFTINGLRAGEYTLEFDGKGIGAGYTWWGSASPASATHVALGSGSVKSVGTITLPSAAAAGTIKGTIVAPGVTDWSGAWVDVSSRFSGASAAVVDGSFSITGLAVASYSVHLSGLKGYDDAWNGGSSSSTLTITAGQTKTVSITPEKRSASVSGTVSNEADGSPVSQADVSLLHRIDGYDQAIAVSSTDANGHYSFPSALVPGRSYTLSVSPRTGPARDVTFVAVAGQQTRDVALARGASMSGSVTDRKTGEPVNGLPVFAVESDDANATSLAFTDETGGYTFDELRPGSYSVRFGEYSSNYSAADLYYGAEWLGGGVAPASATKLTVEDGADMHLQAGQVESAGIISGSVSAKSGTTTVRLPQANVAVYTSGGDYVAGYDVGGGAPGSFSAGLRPGSYKVCASPPSWGPYKDFTPGCWTTTATTTSSNPSTGSVVTVTAGAVRGGIDFTLVKAAALKSATPTISGTPATGSKLTVKPGTWTSGTSFAYQWFVGGVAVSGATSLSYVPVQADDGKKISVRVTGSKAGYATASKTSSATVAVLRVAAPSVSGSVAAGLAVTAVPGAWTSGTSFAYQWSADGKAIKGATKSSLTISSTLKGKQLSVTVTGKKSGYATVAKTSAKTAKVATAAAPAVSGAPVVGSTLTAKPGTWTSGTSFSYQWYAGGVVIPSATKSTLKLSAAQADAALTVKVTGKRSGYATVARTSKATAKTATVATPTVSGSVAAGLTVAAAPGVWTAGTVFSYQWSADGKAIKGATRSSLTISSTLKGKQLSVTVTGKKSGYPTVAKTSAKTGKVATTAVPKITGTAAIGATLKATPGTWTAGTVFAYQWLAEGVAIPGATSSSFTVTPDQSGTALSVAVTGKKAGYATVTRSSTPTARVAPPAPAG